MKTLREVMGEARQNDVAVGHFNIADLVGLKAVFESARALHVPVIVGLSESERDFMGVREAAAVVKVLRQEHDYPIFLNADHTHSLARQNAMGSDFYKLTILARLDIELRHGAPATTIRRGGSLSRDCARQPAAEDLHCGK